MKTCEFSKRLLASPFHDNQWKNPRTLAVKKSPRKAIQDKDGTLLQQGHYQGDNRMFLRGLFSVVTAMFIGYKLF